jgi:hypothetical protein
MPHGHRSQSEADWAFAKRALARGDTADQVIQRIADYRADDKADPLYYARLTVIKAQLSLMSGENDGLARVPPGESAPRPVAGVELPHRSSATRDQR